MNTNMVFLGLLGASSLWAAQKPFPQSLTYPGCIKPSYIKQDSLNNMVKSYYSYWKSSYLRSNLKSLPGGFYVLGDATGSSKGASGKKYKELGTSEGQGYGMILTALMAGYDVDAQTEFDGLLKTAKAYHSVNNPNLMGWIVADSLSAQGDFDSATDGDMDIAYALLLAHEQWGSVGTVNYLAEANRIISQGLKTSYVTSSGRLNLGDWSDLSTFDSRPSDWMLGHLKAFASATGDVSWNLVSDTLNSLIVQIQQKYSPVTGLMPDFVVDANVRPADPNFLEGLNDGNFSYNACRTPLRIVMDYAHNGSAKAKLATEKMVNWLKTQVGDTLAKMESGYTLTGTSVGENYFSTAFVSPMLTASITNPANQNLLNLGWKKIAQSKAGYYEDSINLLAMLLISGNWWAPMGSNGTSSMKKLHSGVNSGLLWDLKGQQSGTLGQSLHTAQGVYIDQSNTKVIVP